VRGSNRPFLVKNGMFSRQRRHLHVAPGLIFKSSNSTMLLPKLSLALNILVLIPVCSGLLLKANWTLDSYGIETPARGILLSIYLTILIFSAALLFKFDAKMVIALLSVQIIYKLLSPIMVGTWTNPVIVSNLFIALFHAYSVWKLSIIEKINPFVS
jgi:hypothetical protein